MTTFVLVHGGWCWRRLVPLLTAAGHEVHTPTLTGTDARAHLGDADTGLATHVWAVTDLADRAWLHPRLRSHPVVTAPDDLAALLASAHPELG